jgi:phenylalanyl-tRNA synthetase alpha chain
LIIEEPIPAFNAQTNPKQDGLSELETQLMVRHLQRTLELLMAHIFTKAKESALAAGNNDPDLLQPLRARWIEAYFPWTAPSFEIEIWWKGEWLEMLGCGIVRDHVLENSGAGDKIGWAFGIGLERSAMILFGIPDIRLFWSTDNRFLHQFKPNTLTTFKPFSKYPGTLRDVAFWVNDTTSQDPASVVHINELMEIVRGVAGDLVENVSLIDEFKHPKTGRISQCYRVNYQAMDRSLTNIEINKFQREILKQLVEKFPIELR